MNKIDKSPCITIINNVRSVNHWFFAIMCPLTIDQIFETQVAL